MRLLNRPLPLWSLLLSALVAFGLGAVAAGFLPAHDNDEVPGVVGELRAGTGRLTNPLLECEVVGNQGMKTLRPFRYKVEELLLEKILSGVISEGTVYFRDLNNGQWFGINENVKYHPASLLKVPIMIACFKVAERNPEFLREKITYRGNFDVASLQGIQPSRELVPGEKYPVEELVERMITLSDNNAAQLLMDALGPRELDQVLLDLDVNVNPDDLEHYISMHGYSGFFRVLYNASYLSREFSEKALQILTGSEFSHGIRGGLPPGQLAAVKFGESGVGPDPTVVQLHEVGIVYYPGRPYLLGIMTRGKRGGDFAAVIREVSRLVYVTVDEHHRAGTQ